MIDIENRYKYRAFISYSHQDKVFAMWVQKQIENYSIPQSLRKKYPHLPKDLKRSLFRDEDELSSVSVLRDILQEALKYSKKLIVICSPSAVASTWVNQEIAYFKKIHGEYAVLAIIKEGKPNISLSKDQDSKEEAFPKALRYRLNEEGSLSSVETEPLAGDAREGKDKEMALLRLIAGILDVDFADLWEREKREIQKRRRIKLFFFFIFLILFWFGYTNYNEKVKIEKHSEIYITLITDIEALKNRIKFVNTEEKIRIWKEIEEKNRRLKEVEEIDTNIQKIEGKITLKAVEIYQVDKNNGVRRALAFLNSEKIAEQEEESIQYLSERWIFKANMHSLEYNYKKAKIFYEKAIAIDFSYRNVLEYGTFLFKQNSYRRAIEIYEKLQKKKCTDEEASAILNNLANLYSVRNQLLKAEVVYGKSLLLRRSLAERNPSLYNASLAKTLNNLANLYSKKNEFYKAEKYYDEALVLYKVLAEKNKILYTPYVIAILNNLASLHIDKGELNKAQKRYFEVLSLRVTLVKSNSTTYTADKAMTLNNLGLLYTAQKRASKAKKMYKRALLLYRVLVDKNPYAYRPDMARILSNLGLLYSSIGAWEKAEEIYYEELAIRRILVKDDERAYLPDLATTLNNLAIVYSARGKVEEAKDVYVEALLLREALAKKDFDRFGIDVVHTLMVGVYKMGLDDESLDKAQDILEKLKRKKGADALFESIKTFKKNFR